MQRVGGPVAHYACRLTSETLLVLWQNLSVEHVVNNLNRCIDKEAFECPLGGPEVEQSLRKQGACREWADQWPIMHADTKRDNIGVLAELERRAGRLGQSRE